MNENRDNIGIAPKKIDATETKLCLFLSKQLIFAKSCINKTIKLCNCKELLGSFSKISLATPGSDGKSSGL